MFERQGRAGGPVPDKGHGGQQQDATGKQRRDALPIPDHFHAFVLGVLHLLSDFCHQAGGCGPRGFQHDIAFHQSAAGMYRVIDAMVYRQRLAIQRRFVEGTAAFDEGPIHRDNVALNQLQAISFGHLPGADPVRYLLPIKAANGLGQGVADSPVSLLDRHALTLLQPATGQQEEHKHGSGIEVDVPASRGHHHQAAGPGQQQCQCDGRIHGQARLPEAAPGSLEKRPTGVEHNRRGHGETG